MNMRTFDKITRHRKKELVMSNERSGMGLREELERLLANNSLSLLGSEARTNGQEQTPRQQQHQTVQEERSTLFRPSSVRPRPGPTTSSTAAMPGPSASASCSSSRSYGPAAGGRGRSMPVSWGRGQAARRPAPYAPERQHQPPKKKVIAKDIYLMEADAIDVPRGPKRVMLFDNKQVRTAVQLNADDNAATFREKIEEEFRAIIDNSKPSPQ